MDIKYFFYVVDKVDISISKLTFVEGTTSSDVNTNDQPKLLFQPKNTTFVCSLGFGQNFAKTSYRITFGSDILTLILSWPIPILLGLHQPARSQIFGYGFSWKLCFSRAPGNTTAVSSWVWPYTMYKETDVLLAAWNRNGSFYFNQ